MGVREKLSLRYVVGLRSIQNTDKYLCKFSVPRGGVERTPNEKQKNRNNADKDAHGTKYGIIRFLLDMILLTQCYY